MSNDSYDILVSNLKKAQFKKNKKTQITALLELAQFHYNNSNFIKAKLLLKDILNINKNQTNVNYYLALIKIDNEEFDKAILYLDKELNISPKNKLAKQLREKLVINSNFPLVTICLLVMNLIVFYFVYPQISFVQSIMYGVSSSTLNIANIVTSLFFHINIYHLGFNMLFLLMYGLILEKNIGSFRFLLIYLFSGIVGNYTQAVLSPGIVIGASSALFGVFGALMIREPLMSTRVFAVFKVPLIILLGGMFIIFAFIESLIVFDFLSFNNGNFAHFFGFLAGVLLTGILYQDKMKVFYNWIFIFFGFFILQVGIESFLISDYLLFIVEILIGVFMISYSYFALKSMDFSL